jgi:hypothetical protein
MCDPNTPGAPPPFVLAVPSVDQVRSALMRRGNPVAPKGAELSALHEAHIYADAALRASVRKLGRGRLPAAIPEGRWDPRPAELLGGAECRLVVQIGFLVRNIGTGVDLGWVVDFAASEEDDPEARLRVHERAAIERMSMTSSLAHNLELVRCVISEVLMFEEWVRGQLLPGSPKPEERPAPLQPAFPSAPALLAVVARAALLLADGPFALAPEEAAAELARDGGPDGGPGGPAGPTLEQQAEALAEAVANAGLSERGLIELARAEFGWPDLRAAEGEARRRAALQAAALERELGRVSLAFLLRGIRRGLLWDIAGANHNFARAAAPEAGGAAVRSPLPERTRLAAGACDEATALRAFLRLQQEVPGARGWVVLRRAFRHPHRVFPGEETSPALAEVAALGRGARLREEAAGAAEWATLVAASRARAAGPGAGAGAGSAR